MNEAFTGMTKPQIVRELCKEIRRLAGNADGLAEIRRTLDEVGPVLEGESPLRYQHPPLVHPEQPKKKGRGGRPRKDPDDPKWSR